ncbi:hypothetical protein [Streptomyces sp. NBC_01210]|uniref:hypothetical protein n=1 Tax=Streptomyces sp. NBC_01210 TaxID=2903774 RepID=UPI003FA34CA7
MSSRPPFGVGLCVCSGRSSESKISYDVVTVSEDLIVEVAMEGTTPRLKVYAKVMLADWPPSLLRLGSQTPVRRPRPSYVCSVFFKLAS